MLVLAFLGFTNFSHSLPLNDKLLHFICLGIATGVFYFIFDVEECVYHCRCSGIDSYYPLGMRGGYGSGAILPSSLQHSSASLQEELSVRSCNLCYPCVCHVWILIHCISSGRHRTRNSKSGMWQRISLDRPSVFTYPTTWKSTIGIEERYLTDPAT